MNELFLMDSDGGNVRRVTPDSIPGVGSGRPPSWSPDGRSLLYSSTESGHRDIWLIDVDDGRRVPVTEGRESDDEPDWSPDGRRVVFARSVDGNRNLWTVARDGSGLAPLTTDPGYESYGTWSPDRERVVYHTLSRGIRSVAADGTDDRPEVDGQLSGWNYGPSWSPDGRWLAFDSRRDGRRGIYVRDVAAGSWKKVTNRERSSAARIAESAGARELARLFSVAETDDLGARFFYPAELELIAEDLMASGDAASALILLQITHEHYPEYWITDDLAAAQERLGRPVPPTRDSIRSVSEREGAAALIESLALASFRFPGWRLLTTGDINAMAASARRDGQRDEEARLYELGIGMYPRRTQFHYRLGQVRESMGETAEALVHYGEAARQRPDDVLTRRALDRLSGG